MLRADSHPEGKAGGALRMYAGGAASVESTLKALPWPHEASDKILVVNLPGNLKPETLRFVKAGAAGAREDLPFSATAFRGPFGNRLEMVSKMPVPHGTLMAVYGATTAPQSVEGGRIVHVDTDTVTISTVENGSTLLNLPEMLRFSGHALWALAKPGALQVELTLPAKNDKPEAMVANLATHALALYDIDGAISFTIEYTLMILGDADITLQGAIIATSAAAMMPLSLSTITVVERRRDRLPNGPQLQRVPENAYAAAPSMTVRPRSSAKSRGRSSGVAGISEPDMMEPSSDGEDAEEYAPTSERSSIYEYSVALAEPLTLTEGSATKLLMGKAQRLHDAHFVYLATVPPYGGEARVTRQVHWDPRDIAFYFTGTCRLVDARPNRPKDRMGTAWLDGWKSSRRMWLDFDKEEQDYVCVKANSSKGFEDLKGTTYVTPTIITNTDTKNYVEVELVFPVQMSTGSVQSDIVSQFVYEGKLANKFQIERQVASLLAGLGADPSNPESELREGWRRAESVQLKPLVFKDSGDSDPSNHELKTIVEQCPKDSYASLMVLVSTKFEEAVGTGTRRVRAVGEEVAGAGIPFEDVWAQT